MLSRIAIVLFGFLLRPTAGALPNATGVDVAAFIYDCWTTDDAVWGHHGANWTGKSHISSGELSGV